MVVVTPTARLDVVGKRYKSIEVSAADHEAWCEAQITADDRLAAHTAWCETLGDDVGMPGSLPRIAAIFIELNAGASTLTADVISRGVKTMPTNDACAGSTDILDEA